PRADVSERRVGEDRTVERREVGLCHEAVLVLDEEPVLLVRHAHQREGAFDLLAAQKESELAFSERLAHAALGLGVIVEPVFVVLIRAVDAAVPDDHFPGAVLARRNDALEGGIVERMVLGLRRQSLFARIERRALWYGPGLEHAVALEAQVV